MNYILVESVGEYSKKVEELGGKMIVPKQTVPGMGHLAVALDPEGNTLDSGKQLAEPPLFS